MPTARTTIGIHTAPFARTVPNSTIITPNMRKFQVATRWIWRAIGSAGLWDRVGRITRVGVVQTLAITAVMIVALTLSDRAVLALFMGSDSPALPIARHIHVLATWNFLLFGVMMVLFGTVRANGAVWIPLVVLAVGLVPVRFGYILATYGWLGADAIWTSFPVTSFINLALAIAFYVHGGWKKARMSVDDRPDQEECIEEALATREPGGALKPAG